MNIFIRIWLTSMYFTVVLISKTKFSNPCHALKNGAAVQGLRNLKLILSQQNVSLMLEKTDYVVCTVSALLPYLAFRCSKHDPLFYDIKVALSHTSSFAHIIALKLLFIQEYNIHIVFKENLPRLLKYPTCI